MASSSSFIPHHREIPHRFGVNLVEKTVKEGRVVYPAPDIEWHTA